MKTTTTLKNSFCLLFLLAGIVAQAQLVTSNADDGNPGTLRSQIASASEGGTILIAPGVTNIVLVSGAITIDKSLTLTGNGLLNTTIDGNANGRIFNITSGNVLLNDCTFTNGLADNGGALSITGANVTINDCTISNSTANQNGGAIYKESNANLIVTNSTISGNTALGNTADNGGGGIFNAGGTVELNGTTFSNNKATGTSGSGGGLFSLTGSVSIVGTFESNSANRAGGAIEIVGGVLTINGAAFIQNDVDGTAGTPNPGNGGAIHISGTTQTTIAGGLFDGNKARREGGALWNQGPLLSIEDSTIRNNTASGAEATQGGGGIFNNGGTLGVAFVTLHNNAANGAAGNGGAIHVKDGMAELLLVTVSGNTAANGGGIYNNATLRINAATITDNTATVNGGGVAAGLLGTLSMGIFKNCLIAANSAVMGQDLFAAADPFTTLGYNLIGEDDAASMVLSMGDATGTSGNPMNVFLGPLADNGGVAFTHALLPGSPAYNAGDPTDQFNDQNGAAVFASIRDIGAVEAQTVLSNPAFAIDNFRKSIVYPNPSVDGKLNIGLSAALGLQTKAVLIEAASGKTVHRFDVSAPSSIIDLTPFTNGFYILQLQSGNLIENHKLLIAH